MKGRDSGKFHLGASANTKINRRDFGVNGAPAMVADDVLITFDVELLRPSSETH